MTSGLKSRYWRKFPKLLFFHGGGTIKKCPPRVAKGGNTLQLGKKRLGELVHEFNMNK